MRLRRCRPKPDIIETNNNLSVRFWMQELMVSRTRLLSAIEVVGCDASAVRDFLTQSEAAAAALSEVTSTDRAPVLQMRSGEAICSVQYVSRASPALTSEDVAAILSWSRAFNYSQRISGILLFTGTHFSQLLEGPPAAVHALLGAIRMDTRHRDVRVVADVAITNRYFQDWSMAWVEDFGLRGLLEELWWVVTRDDESAGKRAAALLQHLRHTFVDGGLTFMNADKRPSPSASNEMQPR